MNLLINKRAVLLLFLLMSLILLVGGCGREDAKNEGCPSGTNTANSTDTLTGVADTTFTVISPAGSPAVNPSILIAPLVFTVTDDQGIPRNKVCIRLFTGGSTGTGVWFSDNTYSTVVAGTGAFNSIVGVTDDAGKLTAYWSTGILPSANPAVGTTAGKDITGQTWVQAFSGVLSARFNLDWTIQGEQAP